MPIYEYRRPDGTTFELRQSFSDEALTVDPDTGVPVERVLHAPAVHFKGNGFYNTDYGTRNRERETAASASASEKGSTSEKSGPSKDSAADGSSSGTGSGSDSASKAADGKGSASEGKDKNAAERSEQAKRARPVAAKR